MNFTCNCIEVGLIFRHHLCKFNRRYHLRIDETYTLHAYYYPGLNLINSLVLFIPKYMPM